MTYNELDVVTLTHEISEYGLHEGDVGTVVSVYNNGDAFEVEFVNLHGKTIALLTLILSDIRSFKSSPITKWINEPLWARLKPNINTENNSEEAENKDFYYQYI